MNKLTVTWRHQNIVKKGNRTVPKSRVYKFPTWRIHTAMVKTVKARQERFIDEVYIRAYREGYGNALKAYIEEELKK